MKKLAVLGCGNIGLSLVEGVLDGNLFQPENIIVTNRNTNYSRPKVRPGVQTSTDNCFAAKNADIVILAVKPNQALDVCREISEVLIAGKQILISVVTGIKMNEISEIIGEGHIIYRAVPNTAISIRESMTCIAANNESGEQDHQIKAIFDHLGKAIFVDEEHLQAATVLGACGIAFAFRFIRAFTQGGIEIGFDAPTAQAIVSQTLKGASEMLVKNNLHPEQEIDKVTTPQGCTIAGLNEMEFQGFTSSLIKGITTSYDIIERLKDK